MKKIALITILMLSIPVSHILASDTIKANNPFIEYTGRIDFTNTLGPMLGDPNLSKIRRYLKFIVDSANKKNNGKLYFFEMSQQTGDLGIGIDYHPTVAQHLRNSLELTKYISQIKGWKINPLGGQTFTFVQISLLNEIHR